MFDQVSDSVIVTGVPSVSASASNVRRNISPPVARPPFAVAKPMRTVLLLSIFEVTIVPLGNTLPSASTNGFTSLSASNACRASFVGSKVMSNEPLTIK